MTRILETTQASINEFLENIGVDLAGTEWVGFRNLVHYSIHEFIRRGGQYSNALEDTTLTLPPYLQPHNGCYFRPVMKVEYMGSWVLLTRAVPERLIKLTVFKADLNIWDTFLVPIDHLDKVLCHLLELPHKKP